MGWLAAPWIRTQVIATEQNPSLGKIDARGYRADESDELRRHHAGVTAELVYLIARGLDAHGRSIFHGLNHRRFDDPRIGGTHGIDADGLVPAVALDHV
jgi:hypothetical protein